MIPVIYIHVGAIPEYLIRSIRQAGKFNKEIYLITDVDIKMNGVNVVDEKKYLDHVSEFEASYKHMSTNTAHFEKICIRRWIILDNFLKKNNIDVCYYSDSDVMLYADMTTVFQQYKEFDAAYTLPEYQDKYRWTASACCSFWKRETLSRFVKFIFESYSSNNIKVLEEKWNYHTKHTIPGGICDMTLLYLFASKVNFYPLSKTKNEIVFDQNFLDGENFYKNEYETELNSIAGRSVKKIAWENSLPWAFNTKENKKVRFAALTEYARYSDASINPIKKLKSYVSRAKNKIGRIYRNLLTPKQKPHGWFGNYPTWEKAESECGGYDSTEILKTVRHSVLKVKNGIAVYERDSVIFDEIQYSDDLIKAFNTSIKEERLHIVDFGGSLGSSYFQHRSLFNKLKDFKWFVVEQKHFVDCGKKEIETEHLKFYYTIDEALKNMQAQVLLLSSVIPYFKEPYELIAKLLSYNFEFIIIDRTAFIEGDKERITKQIVPEFIYKASYPAWFLNEKKFIEAFLVDYTLENDFMSKFDPEEILEDGMRVYRKGFYFKRRNK